MKHPNAMENIWRYKSTHVGYKTVEAMLILSVRTGNNNVNKLKIIKYVSKKGYGEVETKEKGFARIELLFDIMNDANKCLHDREVKKER